jgi:hypothetical protein
VVLTKGNSPSHSTAPSHCGIRRQQGQAFLVDEEKSWDLPPKRSPFIFMTAYPPLLYGFWNDTALRNHSICAGEMANRGGLK